MLLPVPAEEAANDDEPGDNRRGGEGGGGRDSLRMSGRPRTTSFAEGNKPPANPPLGGMKISSKYPDTQCCLHITCMP